ncbi:MAG: molybdopterin-dependent oxidoreductase [Chloroflexi bacterium]|nr:molybdopterin-dependent oxidoreductase [Chloroflexota bacterium]
MTNSTREHLPVHRVPAAARRRAAEPRLELAGLFETPGSLTSEQLQTLPLLDATAAFECEEGWSVPDLRWRGYRLVDVLRLGKPLADARWARIVAGPYAVPLPLDDLQRALLATELDGLPLPVEHGGPWRLVVPGGACFTSVKWVERVELSGEPGESTRETIARERRSEGMDA